MTPRPLSAMSTILVFAAFFASPTLCRAAEDGWALYLDNDVYAPESTDEDYSFGIYFSDFDQTPKAGALGVGSLLSWMDGIVADGRDVDHGRNEYGVFGFTPTNISANQALPDNRPYASLLFAGASRVYVDEENGVSTVTSLTLGALGLDVAKAIQRNQHDLIGDAEPRGWDNQVSDGGELTGRFSWTRRKLMGDSQSFWYDTTVAVGYLSEVRAGIGGIVGGGDPLRSRLMGPTGYGHRSTPPDNSGWSLWYGAEVSARLHNSFIQGQFRDNAVDYSWDETEPLVAQAWLGLEFPITRNWFVSYALNGRTSELKDGPADRHHFWATITVGTALR